MNLEKCFRAMHLARCCRAAPSKYLVHKFYVRQYSQRLASCRKPVSTGRSLISHEFLKVHGSASVLIHRTYAEKMDPPAEVLLGSTPASKEPSTVNTDIVPEELIPPPPTPPPSSEILDTPGVFEELEPTLQSMGLGGWTPSGMVQHCLDYLHGSVGIPWWACIAIGTIVVKTVLFPLVIKGQKNAIHMNNNLPQMQVIQMKMSEARKRGDALESAKYANELMIFMKEKDVNPLRGMIIPFAQAPIFISFFFALRGMANLPMESFKTGGMFWFTDLTVPDPYFLLPIFTSITLFCAMELGAEGGMRTGNLQWSRYVFRAIPLIILPFTINFPAAVLCYWATSNLFSLCQVGVLKIEDVRNYFNIPKLKKHPSQVLPLSSKGFIEGVKESYTNSKISREIDERLRADEIRFRRAGIGPIQKTYAYDPTKQTTAQTKGRSTSDKGIKG